MMIASIFIITFCLVSGIQAEAGVCHGQGWGPGEDGEDHRKIKNCVYVDDSKRGTCARIETAVRCVNSINENCATNALFAGDLTLDYGPREVDSDEPCFHQQFDEYFNQDGLCSFEDAKNLYKCFGDKFDQLDDEEVQAYRNLPIDERLCRMAQFVEMCVKEVRPSCNGFFQRQLRIFAQ